MYTVWEDYGLDGWKPKDFETVKGMIEYINTGVHTSIRITSELYLDVGAECNVIIAQVVLDEPDKVKRCRYHNLCDLDLECVNCVHGNMNGSCPACGRPDGECVCHDPFRQHG